MVVLVLDIVWTTLIIWIVVVAMCSPCWCTRPMSLIQIVTEQGSKFLTWQTSGLDHSHFTKTILNNYKHYLSPWFNSYWYSKWIWICQTQKSTFALVWLGSLNKYFSSFRGALCMFNLKLNAIVVNLKECTCPIQKMAGCASLLCYYVWFSSYKLFPSSWLYQNTCKIFKKTTLKKWKKFLEWSDQTQVEWMITKCKMKSMRNLKRKISGLSDSLEQTISKYNNCRRRDNT